MIIAISKSTIHIESYYIHHIRSSVFFFAVLSSTRSHTADDDSFAGEAIEAGLAVVRLPAGFNQKGQQTGSSESELNGFTKNKR